MDLANTKNITEIFFEKDCWLVSQVNSTFYFINLPEFADLTNYFA